MCMCVCFDITQKSKLNVFKCTSAQVLQHSSTPALHRLRVCVCVWLDLSASYSEIYSKAELDKNENENEKNVHQNVQNEITQRDGKVVA